MTRETYRKMTGYFLQDEKKVRRIILANRLLTGIVFCELSALSDLAAA